MGMSDERSSLLRPGRRLLPFRELFPQPAQDSPSSLLAALRGEIKTVLIPSENVKDLAEIPDNVKNKLEIVPVKWIDEVLERALERMPEPRKAVEPPSQPPVADDKSSTLVTH